MRVYHASSVIVAHPDTEHSRSFLDLYFAGDIGKHDALRRLVYEKPNYQLCFRTQQAIDQCLTFIASHKL